MSIPPEEQYTKQVLLAAFLLIPLTALASISQATLRALKYVINLAFFEDILRPVLFASVILVFYALNVFKVNAVQVIISSMIVTAVILVGEVIFLRIKSVFPKSEPAKSLPKQTWIRTALPLLFLSGFTLILGKTDIIMIGLWMDKESIGFYAVAVRLASLSVFAL